MVVQTTYKGCVYFLNTTWYTPVYLTKELAEGAIEKIYADREKRGFPVDQFMKELIEVPIYDA